MPNKNTTLANLADIVDVDARLFPTLIKTANLGTGVASDTTFLRGDRTWSGAVASIAADAGGTPRSGALKLLPGANVTIVDNQDGTFTFNSTGGGGGGGGSFTASAIWTGGTATKNAYTAPGVVNVQGITISLIASSGSGGITAATISLNGAPCTNTYASTGSWPNLVITIPGADIPSAAQTDANVAISLIGTFNGSGVNLMNAGTLTNAQPVAFNSILSASYSPNILPFYTTTATINYSYSNSSYITAFAGTITPTGGTAQTASAASGAFTAQPIAGAIIGGTATGNGLNGAGSSTVNLSGSIGAVTVYTPAFYVQTINGTPPTITTATTQTNRAAQGASLTYPSATATTQYNWIATQRLLTNIFVVTPFGNSPLVPDVTAPTQTISGQVFNVFGFTNLTVGTAAQLAIT